MSVKPTIGDRAVLEKRIVKNDKFKDTKSTLDTGMNMLNTKAPEKVTDRKAYEKFKRVKSDRLQRLIEDGEEKILVIDVREREDYEEGRMQGALHYPPILLCHATNPFLPQMFTLRNKEGCRVVAYDLDDGVTATKVANLLFEKGFDNIYVLTGGLRDFVRDHAAHVEGTPPPAAPASDARPTRVVRDTDSASGCSSTMHMASRSSVAPSKMSTISNASSSVHKPKSLSSSMSRGQQSGWR